MNDQLAQRGDRPQVPLPSGFKVDGSGPGLIIVRYWFSFALVFSALFCIAWDSFLVNWYLVAFAGDTPWLFKVFPLPHVAVGVTLTYSTLARLLNRTTISVAEGSLRVRHGPLPWFGNQALRTDSLDQLYVDPSYQVCAVTKEGSKVVLVSGLEEMDEALFIEQCVETYLGIEDRSVPGEVSR
jgi:hypothetical protein